MRRLLAACLCLASFLGQAATTKTDDLQPDNLFPQVKMETSMGDIVVELDRTKAPITVNNFLRYVVDGTYNNTVFHRVIKGFVVQGGGYDVKYNARKEREPIFNESGNGLKNRLGTIAMARTDDPHSATSQFYFNMADNDGLDPSPRHWGYTVFGEVMDGLDVLEKIETVPTEYNSAISSPDVPTAPVMLKKVTLMKPQF
ncbi:MAG: peptidylprolyl isomerase [Pseudomonadota bacterium]|uniref:Peptidyl-prolyl cis-trans isomerase n=2 Tax=Gallaecimonas pentaromativorans TaxID=584787 RepID=A0A3N1NRL7_9GAMM|nr:peptidylprolyl isomerase [Gallaecimonas pentaromativorans]MED5525027.1 peptidylprolyl isomerase [Pseudomonadota bacterium]ROQ18763.1 peptidyl-prolyl cis-trans isomerase A (cyclophilin A) [Gallaecimonas pentaromativorans]